ncbi:MAG: ATP-binding protein [bacterium]|nr:ATP-binding protein [bacterium]
MEKETPIKQPTLLLRIKEILKKREKDLVEMDRIAKMLVRRDLELSETREKREQELKELKESKKSLTQMLKEVREAQEKAEEEKNKTLAIIINFTDGLLVLDENNKVLLINPQAEVLLNFKKEKIIGKSILALSKLPQLKNLLDLYKKEIKKDFFREEVEIRESLILYITKTPLKKGKIKIGNLLILNDITREKIIEKAKSEFVSLAAHQLRTPLSALKWILKTFLSDELGRMNKEQKEFLLDAYNSNERMIVLVNDLLNAARIEEGRFLYKLDLTDLDVLIKSVIDSCRDLIREKNIEIEFKNLIKKPLKTLIDADKIKIAIDNILENAIKYSEPDGKIIISLKSDRKEIEASVEDSGLGIPEIQQKRVFSKFFRGANVLRKETDGTGLGLFIAKNIIEAHNGRIWFKSVEGKGTTFYFTLPIGEKA